MTGISSPLRPCGYPEPSHHSWCERIAFAVWAKCGDDRAILLPISGCFLISFHSDFDNLPCLKRISSGIATFPISCSVESRESSARILSDKFKLLPNCSAKILVLSVCSFVTILFSRRILLSEVIVALAMLLL